MTVESLRSRPAGGVSVFDEEVSRRVLLTAIGICIVLLLGCAGAVLYVQFHESDPATVDVAQREFDRVRARFAGQTPLVDMARRAPVDPPVAPTTPAPIRSFHTMIFDTRGHSRLVRLWAPYLVARAFAHQDGAFRWLGELTFLDDTEFDEEPIRLPLEAVKRHGPGLLVDYRHPSGGQFIAWAE